jgi:hypothetical protein
LAAWLLGCLERMRYNSILPLKRLAMIEVAAPPSSPPAERISVSAYVPRYDWRRRLLWRARLGVICASRTPSAKYGLLTAGRSSGSERRFATGAKTCDARVATDGLSLTARITQGPLPASNMRSPLTNATWTQPSMALYIQAR